MSSLRRIGRSLHGGAGPAGQPRRLSAAEELAAFHETALALIEHLDVDTVLHAIVERAGRLVGAEHGVVYVHEPGDTKLTLRVATGLMTARVGFRLGRNEGVAGRVWETGEPLAANDYPDWLLRNGMGAFDAPPFYAVCGVPLVTTAGTRGVFGLAYEEQGRTFGPEDIELLMRFGRLASLALENARLYAAAQQELHERRRAEDELVDTIMRLRRSESEVQHAHEEMIRRLAHAAEFRNAETGKHVDRMSRYCALLAERVGLDDARCELIRIASALHDVGKIAIPDSILLKRGPLDPAERTIMRRHAEIGHSLLSGSRSELLEVAAVIAYTHHERYDGRGYPRGLAGAEIPLEGRIASIADVFDALTSERVYRSALTVEDAISVLRDGRGTHFDPFVLDLFLELLDVPGVPGARPRPATVEPERADRRLRRADETVPVGLVEDACAAAAAVLAEVRDDRQAIDAALEHLHRVSGQVLLPSVYLVEHDRLWMISQRGYEEVRDGFSLAQGVLGRAVRTGRTQYVRDVREDADYVAATERIRSEIAVPFAEPTAGAFNVETRYAELPDAAVPLFCDLAEALALRVAAIGAELAFDLSRLTRLCVYASSLRGVGAIAEFSARVFGRLLSLESAQISLAGSEGHRLGSFWRLPESELKPLDPAEVERVGTLASMVGTAFGVIEASRAGIHDGGPTWLVWLPLQAAGTEVGALVGRATAPPALELDQAEGATLFAQHVAALIDVAAALRREQRAAVTDSLTGLLNRRGFEDRFEEEVERARRSGTPLALVLVDCDDLKEINERGGHADGDAALRGVADGLRATKRSSDVVARVGGDEFTMILPDTDSAAALDAVERMQSRIRDDAADAQLPLTVTCGIASFPADGDSAADVIRAADRLLYEAKLGGGDRALASAPPVEDEIAASARTAAS